MKKTRYCDEQIVRILREADPTRVAQVSKKRSSSEATIHVWRKKFGELDVTDVRHLRLLEQKNARFKKSLAERDFEIEVMKEASSDTRSISFILLIHSLRDNAQTKKQFMHRF